MTLYDLLNEGSSILRQAGDTDAENDAKLLLLNAFDLNLLHFLMDRLRPLSETDAAVQEQIQNYCAMVAKRASRVPLQQILGSQEFMGLDFFVNEHVLIPRQDTETLVEEALKKIRPGMQILDMCTGSGCILESILKFAERKGICVSGTGCDISEEALKVAKENDSRLQTGAVFIQGDLFENIAETYDMIVSNPPYIRTEEISSLEDEVKLHDPWIALDGKTDGLYFYRLIVKESVKHIKKGGYLLFETGFDQGKDVSVLLEEQGYEEIQVKKDLAGLDRVVMGRYNKE